MKSLTTTQASQLLGVSPSSIKRWIDQKLIPCTLTVGGHRRIEQRELIRFWKKRKSGEAGELEARCLDLLLFEPNAQSFQKSLFEAHSLFDSWGKVADMIGNLLEEIGSRWQQGDCDVHTEHLATHVLQEALFLCKAKLPLPHFKYRCLLGSVEGDDHTLGLSMLELCAREAGWDTIWLGAPTSMTVLKNAIESTSPEAVAISASAWSDDAKAMQSYSSKIVKMCKSYRPLLMFGGKGAWPDRISNAHRLETCEEFVSHLQGVISARRKKLIKN
jgi:excisionase family DNA binding protein